MRHDPGIYTFICNALKRRKTLWKCRSFNLFLGLLEMFSPIAVVSCLAIILTAFRVCWYPSPCCCYPYFSDGAKFNVSLGKDSRCLRENFARKSL